MIEINNISKVFRTSEVETVALNHVSLDVKEGEFVAIMGPSGCGKSTLLNILGLLDNPTEGSYKLLGQEVADLKEKERTRVRKGKLGFVFQSFNLIDELNVYENVELPLTYLGVKASERKRMVEDILKRMNISHRAKHFPQQLSGGQQQRVAIARAVVTNPKLILADEPTGNRVFRNATLMAAVTMFFIMLMGLIGYTTDEVRRRSKEIAIRKVNGAEASGILEMLSRDILVVAAPAVVIGTVLAWYVNGMWMEQFAERIPVSWAVYVLVVMANLVIIVACVLWKSWRIANENPVNSIKSE